MIPSVLTLTTGHAKCENKNKNLKWSLFLNYCPSDIMYNVDQQLFDYCTAKFSDNTQCCVPVFDIKHELPLCTEHGQKAVSHSVCLRSDISCYCQPFRGIRVIMITHSCPHKPLRKITVAICSHQVDIPFYTWSDVCFGDLQAKERVWSYMTPNILTKTKCYNKTNSDRAF